MRIRKLLIGLIVGASLIGGSVSVGAWNGGTAASPDTYRCTQINTTPGHLGPTGIALGVVGGSWESYITCTSLSMSS